MLSVVIAYELVRRYRIRAVGQGRRPPARGRTCRRRSGGGGMSAVTTTGTSPGVARGPGRTVVDAAAPRGCACSTSARCCSCCSRRCASSPGSANLTSAGTVAAALAPRRADRHGRSRRPVVRARRRRQHRPRGHDDPRHRSGPAGPATSGGRGSGCSAASPSAPSAALLHAIATVTFGVDQIVSGVAINILAVGLTQYLAAELFTGRAQRGGATQSPPIAADRAPSRCRGSRPGRCELAEQGLVLRLRPGRGDRGPHHQRLLPDHHRHRLLVRSRSSSSGAPRSVCGCGPAARRRTPRRPLGVNVMQVQVHRRRGVGRARRPRRRLPRDRGRQHLPRGPDRRARLHRPRRDDLRQLAPRRPRGRCRALRLHRRAAAARRRRRARAAAAHRDPAGRLRPVAARTSGTRSAASSRS